MSHSWRDNGEWKWAALTVWCDEFEAIHGRPPRLWLDKLCIDQTNISADLQCLPVFLSGCNELLVLSGSSYTSRLWCAAELFVYVNMMDQACDVHQPPTIRVFASNDSEKESVRETWRLFDVSQCQCSAQSDYDRIMDAINHFPGGVQAFSGKVRSIAEKVFEHSSGNEPTQNAVPSEAPLLPNIPDAVVVGNSVARSMSDVDSGFNAVVPVYVRSYSDDS